MIVNSIFEASSPCVIKAENRAWRMIVSSLHSNASWAEMYVASKYLKGVHVGAEAEISLKWRIVCGAHRVKSKSPPTLTLSQSCSISAYARPGWPAHYKMSSGEMKRNTRQLKMHNTIAKGKIERLYYVALCSGKFSHSWWNENK